MTVSNFVATKKAVLFDLFHTLTANESAWSAKVPMTSEMLGIDRRVWNDMLLRGDISGKRLKGYMKDPFEIIAAMARSVRPELPDEVIREVARHRTRRFAESVANMPADTLDTLKALKERGMKLALVSNADVMESAGWKDSPAAEFFDETVFSCDAGMMKPETGIYLYACDKLGVAVSDAVFVGDGGSGELAGAKRAGIAAIFMKGRLTDASEETLARLAAEADYTIERLVELAE